MSDANYCEKCPLQGVANAHCYHVSGHEAPGGGRRWQKLRCCFCKNTARGEQVFDKHGPYASEEPLPPSGPTVRLTLRTKTRSALAARASREHVPVTVAAERILDAALGTGCNRHHAPPHCNHPDCWQD